MSCRSSRKFLCAAGNPQNTTGLNLNFTVLFSEIAFCHISNNFSEIFEKHTQLSREVVL